MACHHERHCDINLIMNEKENREFFKIKDRKNGIYCDCVVRLKA